MDLDYLFNRFEYKPHAGQLKVHKAARQHRKLAVLFGRRGGKSHSASFEAAEVLLEPPHPSFGAPVGLITAPTADLTRAVFERTHDLIFKYLKPFKPKYRRSERYIELQRLGSELYVRSGDKPKSLVSRGYSRVVIDESGFFRNDAFRELEPALLDRQGQLIAIGVPALQNWYFDLFKEAKRGAVDCYALQLPSIVNPAISIKEWHRLFKTIPRLEFLRQYCAKFIEDSSTVWRISDLDKLVGCEPENYLDGAYFAGLDLARKQDYTVLTIVKLVNGFIQVVSTLKLQGQWKTQIPLIAEHLRAYDVLACAVDCTGIGDAVMEMLADNSCSGLQAVTFTNEVKANLIDNLTLDIEQNKIIIPELFEDYHKELKIYEYQLSKTGLRVFSAPDGYHDDHVISLALADWAVKYNYVQ